MPSLVLGVPAAVLSLIQEGLLEREFHDGLFPNLAYRAEFDAEKWEGNTGTEIFMSRPGLLAPVVTPLQPGAEPTVADVPYEQWSMRLDQYGSAIDTDMPTSAVANSNLFLRNIHQLGLQAGQSINRIARNVMFKAYLSGQTTMTASATAGATTLQVAALNGFTDVVTPGSTVRPQPVSAANPLPVTIGTGASLEVKNVIAAAPNDPTDPFGPGVLTLSAGLTNNQALRASVVSAYAPRVVRSTAGSSVDAISASDTLNIQQIVNAVSLLRQSLVQPHDEDGYYHAHISPLSQAQFYADPIFQRLHQSLPDGDAYSEGFVDKMTGIKFIMNQESPTSLNSGTLTATGSSGKYGSEIGAEVTNGAGINIGRVLITGKGAGYERYLDEGLYTTEAGTTGKIGDFDVVNNGVSILTERIRLVIRAPLDRLQQKVSAAWSITTGFSIPSDITAPSGPQRFKRAMILEHAL